jgi:energy-coupling factor transporter transmembrane protein EcfT
MEIEFKSEDLDNEKMINISSDKNIENDYKNILNQKKMIFNKFYTYYYNLNGDPIIAIGPDILFFIFMYIINIIFNIFLLKTLWKHLIFLLKILGIIIILIQQSFYVLTSIINPGLPKKFYQIDRENNPNLYKYCKECKFWYKKKTGTFHCYECGVCIEGYDHHCPWTTKCVGKNNVKLFMGMIITVFLVFGYFIFSVFITSILLN